MKVICFGEILYDVFPSYEVLGGAPLNCAIHLSRLGNESCIVSAVSDDERGERAIAEISENGLSTAFISRVGHPTGVAMITERDGNADYEFNSPAAWDLILVTERDLDALREKGIDALVFGTLSLRCEENRKTLEKLMALKPRHILYDVNIRKEFYSLPLIKRSISLSTIVKMNEKEQALLSRLFEVDESVLHEHLLSSFKGLEMVMITKGEEGIVLYSRESECRKKAKRAEFVDSVGAGDSVTAAFLHFYLKGCSLQETLSKCAELASVVVSSKGAVSKYPEGFLESYL